MEAPTLKTSMHETFTTDYRFGFSNCGYHSCKCCYTTCHHVGRLNTDPDHGGTGAGRADIRHELARS